MTANISIEEKDSYVIMHLIGDFNGSEENDALLKNFKQLSDAAKINVLINLTEVVYLNSASIGVLLSGNAIIKKKNGKVVLYGANDYLKNIFNVTRLNLAFDICNTEDEAAETLKK